MKTKIFDTYQFVTKKLGLGLTQSLVMVVGNTAATGLSAIALMLVSRLLGPVQFGQFSLGFSISLMLARINDLGLNAAISKYGGGSTDNDERNQVFSLVLKYKTITSLLIMLVGVIGFQYFASLMNVENKGIVLIAFTLGLATVYYEYLATILQATHLFFRVVIITAIQAGAKLTGAIGLLILNIKSSSVHLVWYTLAPGIPVLFYQWLLPKWFAITHDKLPKETKNAIIDMAKHSSIAFVSAGIVENVDVLFVQKFFSSYETGLLGGVTRIALLFNLMAYSLGNVLYARVARYKSREHLDAYLKKSWLIVLASALGFALFIPFERLAITLTVGPEYLPGLSVMTVLLAASFATIAVIPFLAMFYTLDASWYFSASGILQLVLVLVGDVILIPMFGIAGAAWTRLISRLVLLLFTIGCVYAVYSKQYQKLPQS